MRARRIADHAVGLYVLSCLLVGGGVDKGLAGDLALEVVALPLICWLFLSVTCTFL